MEEKADLGQVCGWDSRRYTMAGLRVVTPAATPRKKRGHSAAGCGASGSAGGDTRRGNREKEGGEGGGGGGGGGLGGWCPPPLQPSRRPGDRAPRLHR